MKVSMGFIVSRQTAWQFTVNRQPSTVNRQQCRLRLTVKKFQDISNLTISADLNGIPAPKEFLNWENHFSCSKSLFLDSTIPYNLLISEKYLEILWVKGQDNLQNTSVNINSYRSWYLRQFLDLITVSSSKI